MLTAHVPDHVLRTAVVVDDLRLLYAPVPRSGSTSILGALAEIVGLGDDELASSRKLEATRALAVHDGSLWGPSHRLSRKTPKDIQLIFESDEWFRFTVVREPARRLWSAWVTKVLVRDGRFAATFDDALFPDVPASAGDIVESFRSFVSAMPSRDDWHDSHWTSQADLVGLGDVAYTHIGRVEALDQTAAILRARVESKGGLLPPLGKDNPSILPYSAGLFDRHARVACDRWTLRDREAFGYASLPADVGEPDDAWYATVEASIPAVRAVIERNQRIFDLWTLLQEADQAPERWRARVRRRMRPTVAIAQRGLRGRTLRRS